MKFNRAAGIILHPTSLPGPYGIGDIGPGAHMWIDFLAATGSGLWQLLPLGPTGYGDSPYQCFSAFAGNYYIISPDNLIEEGILAADDLKDMPEFPKERVDYGAVIDWKLKILDLAFRRFSASGSNENKDELNRFREEQAAWLDDFALFMAIKESQGGVAWSNWSAPLRRRDSQALEEAQIEFSEAIERQIFYQWLFFRQWEALRAYASDKEVQIIGDIPIFVAHDSADVWAHPELFYMDKDGNPTVVAGVPPDYFSPTGQRWGNPLYRWDVHEETGYSWWLDRFRAVLQMVDIVRLDHFRGFAAYWEVPAANPTAEIGQWTPGPGQKFLKKVRDALGELPIIAEDLGVITPDVVELREKFNLPGMKVFQFAFSEGPEDPFLPHNYPENCVVYTGTHDNDTTRGWFTEASDQEREFCRKYLNRDSSNIAWDMMRAIWGSVAVFSLAPMQDLLNLGSEARMNYPGRPSGNWDWRMRASDMDKQLIRRLKEMNYLYSRSTIKEPTQILESAKDEFEV
jgi:4-alpha-glucanotransferase